MRVHVLGICGTFMGGIAAIAKEAGHDVSGADQNVYPPMSTQLAALGIGLVQGYDAEVPPDVDDIVVGNALSRGKPVIEALLDSGRPYHSGPQWLAERVLRDRWVLAVAGTHGKTTTTSMLAWILEYAGLAPGFLVGGVPRNFGISARLGASKYFVVEADEYDTAFFDKRSKFVHYRPRTLIVNNIEYDHADIFADVDAIIWQFHQLLRTVPRSGLIVANGADANVERLLARGVWTPVTRFSAQDRGAQWWGAYDAVGERSTFSVAKDGAPIGGTTFPLLGAHNLENALAAIAAAGHVGVAPATALAALAKFEGVKRRLELRGTFGGISLYEDFAHHPTAIATTLAGLKSRAGAKRIVAVMEPRSNTMRMGVHRDALAEAFAAADRVFVLGSKTLGWDPADALAALGGRLAVTDDVEALAERLLAELAAGDQVVLMSNGSFQGLPALLQRELEKRHGAG
ncbi:MAG TPA: UDP-N-acetylmuramate:L-alanyl-gamma-D-glutamyl-meso-diaminopimelate ligase [Gammaproteobacteria bacterium]|jgi:UDP-N-acetylmuramate: L-alanyl-gamma-D-glutamyl-meso-diaminopimelate ligase|nr:UDP-N-acetylmuramate:L-alanyl-gamma-D-glutamyl-meso-diaminopimelate ligase [Gammaproteobacteria bacterium]